MHSLLSPTTHADLLIAAQNLAGSLYSALNAETLYTRMLLGTTMGLTIFESALGVTVQDGRTVVERVLIERVLKRSGIEFKADSSEVGCRIDFSTSGRKIGSQFVNQDRDADKSLCYELALIQGVRQYLPELFPHKIYLKSELPAPCPASAEHPLLPKVQAEMKNISRIPVVTADKLTVPKHPNKLALAKDSQTLLDWKKKITEIDIEIPAEWDHRLSLLSDFSFLTEDQKDDVFGSMLEVARSYGVDYNNQTGRFFLAEVPQLTE